VAPEERLLSSIAGLTAARFVLRVEGYEKEKIISTEFVSADPVDPGAMLLIYQAFSPGGRS
jgi:hypothetical protein